MSETVKPVAPVVGEPTNTILTGVIECTYDDIFGTYCGGCFRVVRCPLQEHEATCVAYRDLVIAKKLAAQARDDGDEERADELLTEYLM
jgi:hypothetical protein